MKRRNFLINSAAIFGGCTLFSGCKDELIKKEGQVVRRKFKDITLPLLGFGCGRLPIKNVIDVDMVELDRVVEYAMDHGVNYFDTAYFYVNYKSEIAIGEILKKYPRESYYIADKSPIYMIKTKEDIRRIFNEQLKKCKVDYFDFYMVQGISENNYDIYKSRQMHDELLELKKEGKIKYLGFSFHGTSEILKEVIAEGNWDFCQLQFNYLNWSIFKTDEQYKIVKASKLPIMIMGPLGGGILTKSYNKIAEKLNEQHLDITPAELGLRWAASLDNVVTVLSGMSNLKHIKQNVATFENFKAVTQDEKRIAQDIAKFIQSQGEINCTGCNYCLEACPKGINIPANLAAYNQYKTLKVKVIFITNCETLPKEQRAQNCIKCGLCNKSCTQGLNIPELLAKTTDEYLKAKANLNVKVL